MTIKDVYNIVESKSGLDISIKTRKKEYVLARAVYYCIGYDLFKSSLNQVARLVNRDHATVLHARNNKENYLRDYPYFKKLYNECFLDVKYFLEGNKDDVSENQIKELEDVKELNQTILHLKNEIKKLKRSNKHLNLQLENYKHAENEFGDLPQRLEKLTTAQKRDYQYRMDCFIRMSEDQNKRNGLYTNRRK